MKQVRLKFGFAVTLFVPCLVFAGVGPPQTQGSNPTTHHYQIQLKLDFEARSYTGWENVRWINRDDHSASVVYFHLYSNLRVPNNAPPSAAGPTFIEDDEPRIEITEVRSGPDGPALNYSLEEQGTVLRVNLREPVAGGAATELFLRFKGSVPEIDPDETGLTTHVVKQVSAALRAEREVRRARDLNFRCRSVILLGTAYPVLAVHDGADWQRKVDPGIGDLVFNEAADYDVSVQAAPGVVLFGSGNGTENTTTNETAFSGRSLRDFAILAGPNLRFEQQEIGGITLRSIFLSEHERIGKRVLANASEALRIFTSRFGALPLNTISIAEAPLVAGLGSTEFAGLDVIASAFYVDFDSPSVRNLPEIIREQRPAVEQSLEWSVAHLISHEWWGGMVGNNPAREPVLDESMAGWSALLYFRELYGEQKAASVLEDQLRGVYRLYRTFGGVDMNADRPSRDYQNSFQYSALVSAKGALMLVQVQRLLGEEKLLKALRNYYQAQRGAIARVDDLRDAIMAESSVEQRRMVARTFTRWLSNKRGDEDISGPDQELANSLGLAPKANTQRGNDRNALSAFARVGKFFWQQMTRIR
ncbi:MAG TPA: M1 family aminopeptidase [Pyrinomonadaceae bacterium]|nr:M1 family aminopeptidase [Pyrinomonadaceae bacterium]